jgi:uncharacterized protein YpmB
VLISVPAGTPLPAIKYKIAGGHGQTLLIIIIIIIIIIIKIIIISHYRFFIYPYTLYKKIRKSQKYKKVKSASDLKM